VRKLYSVIACVAILTVIHGAEIGAQQTPQSIPRVTPLDVQVVLTRLQADKKVSSLPFQLSVNATGPGEPAQETNLRMGAQVPLPTMATPTVDGKPVTGMLTTNPVQYKDIGTFIDAYARNLGNGSYELRISVSDTSVYVGPASAYTGPAASGSSATMGLPVLRTYASSNNMVLKDGQTKQFTLAADRVSGETLRVDVSVAVSK
jgi:hypothetical protein